MRKTILSLFFTFGAMSFFATVTAFADSDFEWLTECDSFDHQEGRCYASGMIESVETIHQESNSSCIEGLSYFIQGKGIKVTRGCRADFEVRVRNYIPPVPYANVTCYSKTNKRLYLGRMSPSGRAIVKAPSGRSMWAVSGCSRHSGTCSLMLNCFPDSEVSALYRKGEERLLDFHDQKICEFNGPNYVRGETFYAGSGKNLGRCVVQ